MMNVLNTRAMKRSRWLSVGRFLLAAMLWSSVTVAVTLAQQDETAQSVDYVRDIKPILSNSCYTCHGPDKETREADLRLDVREQATEHVIVPGQPQASELLRRVTAEDPDERMPPSDSLRPSLNDDQIERLRQWIAQGAAFEQHWSLVPPRRPAVPAVQQPEWTWNPIDRFIVARLQQAQLEPAELADWRTLVRRLAFDLTGLPPTARQLQYDPRRPRGDQLSRLVDQLLASPAFGERMAAYWLDVVRYADSVGIHGDQENSMSPYRDYVIAAFNANMPYDQFVTEQLAGDLLPQATTMQRVASAFNRLHMITSEGGAQEKEYLAIYAADRVRNTGAALLGMTLGCAQCHDHKFDPISLREFYQFAAFFADLKETGVYHGNNWFPKLEVPTPGQQRQIEQLQARLARLQEDVPGDLAEDDPRRAPLQALQQQLEAIQKQVPTVLVSMSVEPRTIRVLPRGNWLDDSGEVVQPALPSALGWSESSSQRLTRLDLAEWMVAPQNPLVARVLVNRLWKLMFGQGLVTTLDDFGAQGDVPSHPQLLDWLAVEFVQSGWDVKHVLRLMATSRTYQQSSQMTTLLRQRDPANRLWARQNRFRLDAEMVRDNALAVSGLLMHRVGGPSVRPYQPAGYYKHLNFPRRTYQPSTGADLYRRTVYTHWQRTFLHPSLQAFDAPTREECTAQRPRSNTPLQSLVLLNDPIYVEAARVLAARSVQQPAETDRERLEQMVRDALQRPATTEETTVLLDLLNRHRQHYATHRQAADEVLTNGQMATPSELDRVELAAWTSVARTLLNLHESLTRY